MTPQTLTESMRALLTRLDEAQAAGLTFRDEMRNYSHGQSDLRLIAYRDGTAVGHIDYAEYEGEPSIQHILTYEGYGRQGIATALLRTLQAKYPVTEIDWGSLTPDGSKLHAAIPKVTVPVPEIQDKLNRLEAAKAREAELRSYVEDLTSGEMTQEKRDAINALSDEFNDLSDLIYQLEQETLWAKPTKTLITTESLTESEQPLDPKRAEIMRLFRLFHSLPVPKGYVGRPMSPAAFQATVMARSDAELDDWIADLRQQIQDRGGDASLDPEKALVWSMYQEAQKLPHPNKISWWLADPKTYRGFLDTADPAALARMKANLEEYLAAARKVRKRKPKDLVAAGRLYDKGISKKFLPWLKTLLDNPKELREVQADRDWLLDYYKEYLQGELSLRIREDGRLEPTYRISRELAQLLRGEIVVMKHHTASGALKRIKAEGLHTDHGERANPHQNSYTGVYLTVEDSGPAVNGYLHNATQKWGGGQVTLLVAVPYDDLEPDPDDADITSGRVQYVIDRVEPQQIIGVERQ